MKDAFLIWGPDSWECVDFEKIHQATIHELIIFLQVYFLSLKEEKNKAAEDSGSYRGRGNWLQKGLHSALQFLFIILDFESIV